MMRLVVVLLLLCVLSARAQSVKFSVPNPSCTTSGDIQCYEDAHDGVQGQESIELTEIPGPREGSNTTGYVFFRNPVQMHDSGTGRAISFSATFTFQITKGTNFTRYGDGVSFVMYEDPTYRGMSGGMLGVYQGVQTTKTFCVEYDTYMNASDDLHDPNDNHVGLDFASIVSMKTADAGIVGIRLNGGYPITTWIDYNSSQWNTEVRIANSSDTRPADALLTYKHDLSDIVAKFMTVGIAATSGGRTQAHKLHNLSFETFLPPPSKSNSRTGLIVGISVGIASLLGLCCLGGCFWFWRVKRLKSGNNFHKLPLLDAPARFTYKELSMATNGFSESSQLGKGGSSSVYRGVIASTGTPVAVKRVATEAKEGEKQFLAEVNVLSRLRHRNLVKLLGWCSEKGQFLLVYELMPNGSLDKPLFLQSGDDKVLSWTQRLAIVRGVAAGLAYLHTGSAQQVIHRDIKSSNVMLDEDFNAKLGDFGLARLIDHSKNPATTNVAGTIGYIAPEAYVEFRSTDKMDVFAFGVLVLEVASARRPININLPADDIILLDWVWKCHAEGDILKAADPRLAGAFPELEMTNILQMGLLCTHPDPPERPSIRQVELFLSGDLPLPPLPLHKPVAVYSRSRDRLKRILSETPLKSNNSGSGPVFMSYSLSSGSVPRISN